MKDHKVFKDFTKEQDAALRKWLKEGKECFVCGSKELLRLGGHVTCENCGLKVMDFDHEPEPTGVM